MSGVASEDHSLLNMLTLGHELSIAVIIGKKNCWRKQVNTQQLFIQDINKLLKLGGIANLVPVCYMNSLSRYIDI